MPTDPLPSLLANIAISIAVSVVTVWGLGGRVHPRFYVRRRDQPMRWKLQPKRFLSPKLTRHAFLLGSFNIMMGATIGGSFAWHVSRGGWSALYLDPLEYPVWWIPISAVLTYFAIDAGLYASHRLFHRRFLC